MRTKNKLKEPAEVGTQTGSKDNTSTNTNNNTVKADKQVKGRFFWFLVYPSEDYLQKNYPDCQYDGSSGYGTAPDDWIDKMKLTGLPFCVSPLHDKDTNPDGTCKKPHWHVIVVWGNSTTLNSVNSLVSKFNSPKPQKLESVEGAYRYHKHLDNPEKYQYEGNSSVYNGFEVPLRTCDVQRIKREIKDLVFTEDIREYAELLVTCDVLGPEYFDVASNNTFYCEKLCASYRHNPIRVLMKYYNTLPDGDTKNQIRERIDSYKLYEKTSN